MKSTNSIWRAPLFWLLVAFTGIYLVTAKHTDAPGLLLFQNAILAALSLGVVVAYGPEALRALRSPRPTQGELLTFGIFVAWLGTMGARFLGVLRYGLERPDLFGSDYSTFVAFTIGVAALCHLAAPEAIDGWLPRRTFVRIGVWIATGIIALVLVVTARNYWQFLTGVFGL